MANTYTSLFYHIVFSTKGRLPWIQPAIAPRIWEYLGGVARAHKMTALQVGGMDDHAHVLVMAPPTIAPSQIAQYIKGDSSKYTSRPSHNTTGNVPFRKNIWSFYNATASSMMNVTSGDNPVPSGRLSLGCHPYYNHPAPSGRLSGYPSGGPMGRGTVGDIGSWPKLNRPSGTGV